MFPFVFLFLAYLVPNHYLPWKSFYNEAMVFAFLLCACFVFRGGRLGAVAWGCVGLFIVSVVQYMLGVIHYFSTLWLVGCYLGAAVLAYALGARQGSEKFSACAFSWTFLCAGIISSWIALSQWFDTSQFMLFEFTGAALRVTGNLAQANHLAALMLLALVSVFYLRQRFALSAATAVLCSLLFLLVLALTQSRMGGLGLLVFMGGWFFKLKRQSLIDWKLVLILLLWFSFFFFCNKQVADFLLLSSDAAGVDRLISADRLDIWRQSLCAVSKSPLLGYGLGQGGVQYLMALECPLQMLSLHSHNIVLDLLIWLGPILGGVCVLFSCYRAYRWWAVASDVESIYILCAVSVFALHALLEYPLEYSYFLIPLFWFVGALDARAAKIVVSSRVMVFSALLGVLMFSVTWWDYRKAEEDFRKIRLEFARLASPSESFEYLILDDISEQLFVARLNPYQGMSDDLIGRVRTVAQLYPYAPLLQRYVQSLALNGREAEAVDVTLRYQSIYGDAAFKELKLQFEDVKYAKFREVLEKNEL